MEVRELKVLGGDGERGYLPDDALLELPESLGKNGSINANRVFQNALSAEVLHRYTRFVPKPTVATRDNVNLEDVARQESGSMQRPTVVNGVNFQLSLMKTWNLTFKSKRVITRWRGSSIRAKNSAWFGASAQDVWLQNGLLSFKHHEFMEGYECPLQSPRTLLFELCRFAWKRDFNRGKEFSKS